MGTPSTATTATAAGAQGIQVLLEAEKEASRIVQKARQYRVQRLKDARTEATAEIEALREQKQEEYTSYERAMSGSLDASLGEWTRETEMRLEEIRKQASQDRGQSVQMLLDAALKVDPKPHPNILLKLQQPLPTQHDY